MKSAFELVRKHAKADAEKKLVPALDAALSNEMITRKRVDAIEALLSRSFLGRFRWLIFGR